ncbi:MAG: biosynthetic peptidoglycan transglycosylase [Gemmatimonadota bacterium]
MPARRVASDPRPRSFRRKLALGVVAAGGLFLLWLFAVWPPPVWYATHFPHETAFMAMRRDVDPGAAEKRRYDPVPLSEIAPAVRRAVMIGEDNRFYEHSGFDLIEMRKALGYPRDSFSLGNTRDRRDLIRAVRRGWSQRESVRGASTITQQLAKNLYLSPSRNPLRKVKEAVTAWRLELWLSKDRIMELYLNTAEMGEEVWGAEAAAQRYFHRSAKGLTLGQAATLAAVLPFPRSSNPNYRPGRMNWRRNLILRRLGGEPVVVPPEDEESAPVDIPAPIPDSVLPPVDSLPTGRTSR